jgi:glutamyl-tRNA synthetase
MARRHGWKIVLRIEDLDGPRVKAGADREAVDILQWLGLDWDEGPYYQLHDLSRYRAAMERLAETDLIYPCTCTRSQIALAQSAPHGDEHELRYPGTCRPDPGGTKVICETNGEACWRLRVADAPVQFTDTIHGVMAINVQQQVGDFIVATKAGLPAYQLAVVVDDAAQRVTQVVRGDDLIRSTPRQILIHQALGLDPWPQYTHVPLVLGPDGRRLAKRHGDSRLARYRQEGVRAERILGLLASWSGAGLREPMAAATFADRFRLDALSRDPVTFTQDDERWLLEGTCLCSDMSGGRWMRQARAAAI